MGQILDLLKETAVFMLAAQMILHFLPGKKYEKYGKMMIALVVLSQLALPVLSIGREDAAQIFWEKFSDLEAENEIFSEKMENMEGTGEVLVQNAVVASVEEKVSAAAQNAGVTVSEVRLKEDGVVMIEVKKERSAAAVDAKGPVTVDRIQIGQADVSEDAAAQTDAGAQKGARRPDLAKAFAAALGMGEEKVEVIEFG